MKLLLNYTLNLSSQQRSDLESIWPGLTIVEGRIDDLDAYDGRSVLALVTEPVPRDLARWPDLRWVQLLSAGANHLRGHPVRRSSVTVTTASGTHGVPIAQFVTCTWLMMAHQMVRVADFQRSHTWPNRIALGGFPVRGLTAGIVGYGSIGRECARQLSALGMRIVCAKRNVSQHEDRDYNAWAETGDPDGTLPAAWFGPDQLSEMLSQCDLVVVAAPSTPATEGLIGAAEFAQMKSSARMIIVSRGGIVAEAALADALRTGRIAGAVVDCYVQEPLPPDHFYFGVPNLLMTPHVSGIYDTFATAMVPLIVENLRRLKAGLPLLNRTNPTAGYNFCMILDDLKNWRTYAALSPRFEKAFDYLERFDPATPPGRQEIDGEDVYAIVQDHLTKPIAEKQFEVHRRYLDIHGVVRGREHIHWLPLAELSEITRPYNPEADEALFARPADSLAVPVRAGQFAILFPQDGHAPSCAWGESALVQKVVLKVRL